MVRMNCFYAVACLAIATAVGCGDGLVDVEAQVTLDGKPLERAAVSLVSTGDVQTRTATGMTDAQGLTRFTSYQPGDGVTPGEYKVVVIKQPESVEAELASFDPENPEDMKRYQALQRSTVTSYTRTALPRVYLNPEQTPLSCKVDSDTDKLVFELTTEGH